MGGGDAHPVLAALFADDRQADGLAPVVVVDLLPGPVLFAGLEGHEAGGLGGLHRVGDGLPLGLGQVQELLVAHAELIGLLQLFGAGLGSAVGLIDEELFRQLLGVDLLGLGFSWHNGFLLW